MIDVPESHRDLLETQVATLATVDPQGFPQLTAVWFVVDGDELRISLNESRRKTRNLRERPECSVFVLDLQNPYRYLEIRGRARVEPDEGGALVRAVEQKYDADLTAYDEPGDTRVAVTIEPVKVHAVAMG